VGLPRGSGRHSFFCRGDTPARSGVHEHATTNPLDRFAGRTPGRFQVQPLPGRRVANDLLRMTAPHEHVPDTATPILGAAAITALA
jgi:hypothetical protein